MRRRGLFSGGCVLVALVTLAWPEFGFAQCARGTRIMTKGERRFVEETFTVLKAAVPDPPPGWQVADQTEVRAPRGICIGREKRPLALYFVTRYEPAVELSGGRHLVPVAYHDGADSAAAQVLITVNTPRNVFVGKVEPVSLSEVPLAFRHASDGGSASVDLLLGDWSVFHPDDPDDPVEAMAHFVPGLSYMRVQSILVQVDGPPTSVAQMLAALDTPALRAMLPH